MQKHVWLWWRKGDVAVEKEQMQDEGRDPSLLAEEFAALESLDDDTAEFQDGFNVVLDQIQELPISSDDDEPSDLAAIRDTRPDGARKLGNVADDLENRIHGGWLGRCAGCLLGKPIEGWRTDLVWGILKDTGHAMIPDYLFKLDIDDEIIEKHDSSGHPEKFSKRLAGFKGIRHMPEDDDTNYTVTGLALVKNKGLDFSPDDMASFWMQNIPILHTCTAERVAYRNFVAGIWPTDSAEHRNPYREWIGAQIRADFFGYVSPGNPELAAELAWRDACISHVRNGVYGEMWVAAMLAAAAVEMDIRTIIRTGLAEIPVNCRLAADINQVIGWYETGVSYLDAVSRIHERWDETKGHHWCHTNSNAQIVTLGLLYGEGDFEKTITRAVYPCFDTDCNGATAGSVIGMVLGAKALPMKWIDTLNDTLLTGVAGYHVVGISDLAKETLELVNRD